MSNDKELTIDEKLNQERETKKKSVLKEISDKGPSEQKDMFKDKEAFLNKTKRKPKSPDSPVGEYHEIRAISDDSGNPGYINRLLVAVPTTGLVRIEWVNARYGQIIPTNWSMVTLTEYMGAYVPIRYQLEDAQNLIVKKAIEGGFEWLFLLEHDVMLPPDAFIRFNEYMRQPNDPVVSGLYFTKTVPAEPMIYRGRGNSFYTNWKLGDKVYADGVPTGCLLIHVGLLKAIWEDSPEYNVRGQVTRRVFSNPAKLWYDPENGQYNTTSGTTDLEWCTRVMKGNYLEKAGWKKHAKMKYPFLVDTNIFCRQIDENGEQYP